MQRAGTTSETKTVSSQFALYLNLNLFFILCFCNKLERVVVAFYATYKYLEWSCTHSKKMCPNKYFFILVFSTFVVLL